MAPGAAGNVSLNATPPSESLTFGFVIVKVRVETPFGRIGDGSNCLSITGGRRAVRESVPTVVVVVPVSVVERKPLTLP